MWWCRCISHLPPLGSQRERRKLRPHTVCCTLRHTRKSWNGGEGRHTRKSWSGGEGRHTRKNWSGGEGRHTRKSGNGSDACCDRRMGWDG